MNKTHKEEIAQFTLSQLTTTLYEISAENSNSYTYSIETTNFLDEADNLLVFAMHDIDTEKEAEKQLLQEIKRVLLKFSKQEL